MKKVAFPLSTTAPEFAQWLSHHTQDVYPRHLAPERPAGGRGRCFLQPVRLPGRTVSEQLIALEVPFSYEPEREEATPENYQELSAIRFTVSIPVPTFAPNRILVMAECDHDPALGDFEELLREIGWRWPESRETIEATLEGRGPKPATVIEAVLEDIYEEMGWPVARARTDDSFSVFHSVPLDPREVCRHLRELCDNDPLFSIRDNADINEDRHKVTIWARQTIAQGNSTAEWTTIGTIQLWTSGTDTVIRFVANNMRYFEKLPDTGKDLFYKFIQRVKGYFDELTCRQVETQPRPIRKPPFPGFPMTQRGIEKWRRSYQVILEIRKEYRRLYDAGDTDEPNPSDDDLRDALASMPEWKKKPSPLTVRRIRRAGEKGLLA